jgi:hypothetical protein
MIGLSALVQPGLPPARVDENLRDPDKDSLGIKKRGRGAVEIKGLISRRNKHLDFAGCTSRIELWAKWASRTFDLDGLPLIRVERQRWKRSFSVHAGAVSERRGLRFPCTAPQEGGTGPGRRRSCLPDTPREMRPRPVHNRRQCQRRNVQTSERCSIGSLISVKAPRRPARTAARGRKLGLACRAV